MATPYRKSPSGIESQFAGNHLGHFLFTNLILSKLASHGSDRPRVVNVSSGGHQNSGIRFEDLNFKEGETYQPCESSIR